MGRRSDGSFTSGALLFSASMTVRALHELTGSELELQHRHHLEANLRVAGQREAVDPTRGGSQELRGGYNTSEA